MAVMRVEKNSNYTIMANYHLRDKNLSLKSKGLLSVMLSLPSDWDYTLAGLTRISKEGIDAIRAAVVELEKAGYIIRSRRRNEKGQLADIEYTIYETPQTDGMEYCSFQTAVYPETISPETSAFKSPALENPIQAFPVQDIPVQEEPAQDHPMQLNKEVLKKDILITNKSNPYQSNIHLSDPEDDIQALHDSPDNPTSASNLHQTQTNISGRQKQESSSFPASAGIHRRLTLNELTNKIKKQVDYWDLIDGNSKEEIDNILAIIVEVLSAKCDHFTISGKQYPAELVHQRYSQININTIEYVLECLKKSGSDIHNIKQYLITALFNAPATYDSYYTAAVRRDFEYTR